MSIRISEAFAERAKIAELAYEAASINNLSAPAVSPEAYKAIIEVAEKIPSNVLEEDPKLLMWYDQAITRSGGEI